MALTPSQMKEHIGTVVPVGTDQPVTVKIPGQTPAAAGGGPGGPTLLQQLQSGVKPQQAAPMGPPAAPAPGAFKLVSGAGDEHRILTTPGGGASPLPPPGGPQFAGAVYQGGQNNGGYPPQPPRPPKFSVIVNEYIGGCVEDHCNIGKKG